MWPLNSSTWPDCSNLMQLGEMLPSVSGPLVKVEVETSNY